MGKIEKILKKGPVEGQTTEVYPVTSTKAVYDENNKRLDNIITGLQESVYLNTPIPISTDDTTESKVQNVKNITNYVEKAKAAGIADVNGMAVTCLIDENYSGVGYLYSYDGAPIWVTGIITYDESVVSPTVFVVDNEGFCSEKEVVMKDLFDQVTSDMLVQGARKPIILTPDTTKVDEETYQKLLSDDVDVMFKTSTESANLCTLTYKFDDGNSLVLHFTCFSVEGIQATDSYIYAYKVSIIKTNPHTCRITKNYDSSFNSFLIRLGYLKDSTLSPVLQNINLTGTDEDRKAKLDQFARNWKTLTGASDLNGARFVGNVSMNDGATTNVLLSMDMDENYSGISMSDDVDVSHLKKIVVHPNNGSVESFPLFSHLEAITIQTLNIPANKKKNSDAIQAYVNNLAGIGVDVTKGYTIPIKTVGFEDGVGVIYPNVDKSYKGICIANGHSYIITISKDGTWDKRDLLDSGSDYTVLNTSAKDILSAINEINTLTNNKQDTLTSGTNIKTINNQSILGSGDITITSSGGAYPEVNHGTGDTTFTLTPNTFHVWDEVASLTLNFGSGISGMANEYLFQFTSGPTATSLALPDDIKWANDNVPTIEANMIYQVSILHGLASVLEFK